MGDDIIPLLRVHEYFRTASDEALQELVRQARVTSHAAGSVVHDANEILATIGFVLRGRLKAVRVDARGTESLFRMIERGEQFGMMVGALTEPVPIRLVALEPTTVLSLDYEQAMELTLRFADLRRLWLKTYAESLQKLLLGSTPRRPPAVLALISETPAAHSVARRVLERLASLGENLSVFSDSNEWQHVPRVRFRPLHADGRWLDADAIHQQLTDWQDAHRIVFDVHEEMEPARAVQLLGLVDHAIYFVPADSSQTAVRRLRALDVATHGWRDKISIAWLLESDTPVGPALPELHDLVYRDFKIKDAPHRFPWGRVTTDGLERVVHELRGVRIGVALGGGAARGMAHLGVLKALEQNGIVVDAVAGTSAGALTGVVYACGLDNDYSASRFATDLRPPWPFRRLRQGSQWYLVYKFRTGRFDPMLRQYLHDWTLEQLPVPGVSVTADLVGGKAVIRNRGDAVRAVLESINLPVLSVPICHHGQALIDGGLVDNIPADVLVSMGCNFVIAVSVTARLEQEFCDITRNQPMPRGKKPNVVETLLRSLTVQNHNLNAIGVRPADVVIEPDVTGFDLSEFMRAKELAAIGEAAALEQIPHIRRLLSRLDPQLFCQSGDRDSPMHPD